MASRRAWAASRTDGFERGPVLFLVRRQLERRLHAGEMRVEHEAADFARVAGRRRRVAGSGGGAEGDNRAAQSRDGESATTNFFMAEPFGWKRRSQRLGLVAD
jgi:hypothetical protein